MQRIDFTATETFSPWSVCNICGIIAADIKKDLAHFLDVECLLHYLANEGILAAVFWVSFFFIFFFMLHRGHSPWDFYLLCLPFILSCTEKLSLPNLQNAKEGPGTWRNTEEMLRHCIFNKPCQICSKPTACKPRSQHTVCILNMPNELCRRVHARTVITPSANRTFNTNYAQQSNVSMCGALATANDKWGCCLQRSHRMWTNNFCSGQLWARQRVGSGKQTAAMSSLQEWAHLGTTRLKRTVRRGRGKATSEKILNRIHMREGSYMVMHKNVHAHRHVVPVIILQQLFLINDRYWTKIMDPNLCFCSKVWIKAKNSSINRNYISSRCHVKNITLIKT